jgi:hypothetical protein
MTAEELLAWQGPLVTVVAIALLGTIAVLIWREYTRSAEAKALVTRDQAYRDLAEAQLAAQRQHAGEVAALAAEMAELRRATTAIEKLLREVN